MQGNNIGFVIFPYRHCFFYGNLMYNRINQGIDNEVLFPEYFKNISLTYLLKNNFEDIKEHFYQKVPVYYAGRETVEKYYYEKKYKDYREISLSINKKSGNRDKQRLSPIAFVGATLNEFIFLKKIEVNSGKIGGAKIEKNVFCIMRS